MGPTGDAVRVVQLHPTRRCNLRCLHCYSASGPEQRGELPLAALRRFLHDAAREGYTVCSVSGGEPLLYTELPALLDAARDAGLAATLVTNGLLLTPRRAAMLAEKADLVAVSVDGAPATHDRLRARPGAFDRTAARLALLRDAGVPFGIITTLTRESAPELPWLARFAAEQGARLLQVHPLEAVGRGADAGPEPDDYERALAWLALRALDQQAGDALRIRTDLLDVEAVRHAPERVLAAADAGACDASRTAPLGTLLSPLVVEPDGAIVPLEYGFPRDWAVGHVLDAPLADRAAAWRAERWPAFAALCRRVLAELCDAPELPIVNWYRAVARAAERDATAAPAGAA